MKTLPILSIGDIDVLRSQVQLSEEAGALTAAQLEIIYKEKWFNMYLPPKYGGLGLGLPEAVKLIEKLAWVNGSIGWAVTLGSGANMFMGYLSEAAIAEFFNNPKVCVAGNGSNTGTATKVDGGYIINGNWKYATGSLHATAFTANCVIVEDNGEGRISTGESGSFIFKRDEVTVSRDWNGIGMKATSTNSFAVHHLFVPEERKFSIDPVAATLPDLLFQFPFLQFSEATLVANISGMVMHYTEECRRSFEERIIHKTLPLEQSSEMLELLGRTMTCIEKSRDLFHQTLASVWEHGKDTKQWDSKLLTRLSITSKRMVRELLQMVDGLHPYTGMEGADQRSDLNRIWRDIHTASQHQLVTFKHPVTAC